MNKIFKNIIVAILISPLIIWCLAGSSISVQAKTDAKLTFDGRKERFLIPVDLPDLNAIRIYTAQDLYNVRNNLSASYVMMNDIDLAEFNGGEWTPIGNNDVSKRFIGTFDGQGYVIRNLKITTAPTNSWGGLFSYAENATIKNLGMEGTFINYQYAGAGAVCGNNGKDSRIINCYNAGEISGNNVGGISVYNSGTISYCYNTGHITASSTSSFSDGVAAGICADNWGVIAKCYNTGKISSLSNYSAAKARVGGISTSNQNGAITDCYNTGNLYAASTDGSAEIAGISTSNDFGTIRNCYNTGNITANCGTSLVHHALIGSICVYSYYNSVLNNCYWNIDSFQVGASLAGTSIAENKGVVESGDDISSTPLSTAKMKQQSSFVGFDFNNVWRMVEGYDYPQLSSSPGGNQNNHNNNGSHTYKVFDYNLSWEEARDYCESLGGHLVTITSVDEQNYVYNLIRDDKMNIYWIGGTDARREGIWEWVTSEPWDFTHWSNGEPNGGSNENYVCMYRVSAPDSSTVIASFWNDQSNGGYTGFHGIENIGFICEWDDVRVYTESSAEYVLESKHFKWEASIDYLINAGVTPEKFLTYLNRSDIIYETYVELTGRMPYNGEKLTFNVSRDGHGALWVNGPNIFIAEGGNLDNLLRYIGFNDTWDFGTCHEISHVFDEGGLWNFSGEFSANFKLYYAFWKTGAVNRGDSGIEDYMALRTSAYAKSKSLFDSGNLERFGKFLGNNGDGFQYYFMTIVDSVGWDVFVKVYHSYYDDSYTPQYVYKGSGDAVRLNDFLDRIVFFSGTQPRDLFSDTELYVLNKFYPVSKELKPLKQ